jgi:glycosyltransferase involved in cell wall biosynthesis
VYYIQFEFYYAFKIINQMKISLVIPVKNEAESNENLYLSIRRQTLQPDEIIAVDGSSTDKTIEIARKITADQTELNWLKRRRPHREKGVTSVSKMPGRNGLEIQFWHQE